ncbi:hypothetical protein EHM92_07535 [bacterium]|nr:MAG: hypothetical protein EHM92_07535 [bacterium]
MSEIREFVAAVTSNDREEAEEAKYERADQYLRAAGGTVNGLIALIRSAESWYTELQQITALPYDQYVPASKAFYEKVRNSDNPFVRTFLPVMEKSRAREFLDQVYLNMLRAAVQFRLRGEEGLKSVRDPFGSQPFAYSRFIFQNVDRGFTLQSSVAWEFPIKLIFVEKSGLPFRVIGVYPGTPVEPPSSAQ